MLIKYIHTFGKESKSRQIKCFPWKVMASKANNICFKILVGSEPQINEDNQDSWRLYGDIFIIKLFSKNWSKKIIRKR